MQKKKKKSPAFVIRYLYFIQEMNKTDIMNV